MRPRALVVRRARIGPAELDLRTEDDRIAEIGRGLRRAPGETELDGHGHAVLPGLHDHHLHLLAWAAARRSVLAGPPDIRDRAELSAALAGAAAARPPGAWIRAVGYHQSVAGDLDRDVLDRMVGDHPVRVQHRSGALWVCNSAGLEALAAGSETAAGIERDSSGRPTGRLWRMDSWLAARLGHPTARDDGDLAALSADASRAGITGWTDATAERSDTDTHELLAAVASGTVRQRLHLMLPTDQAEDGRGARTPIGFHDIHRAIRGEHRENRTGIRPEPGRSMSPEALEALEDGRVTAGPVKIMLDDSHLPSLDDMTGLIARAHRRRQPVAVHCVTRVQLLLTLAALESAGVHPGDRIEHGAVIPVESLARLSGWGLTVVTQPNFVAERGDDYLAEVNAADLPDLWRGRSLVEAGVAVAAGTDAPFGSPDPWSAVRAAVRRRTPAGRVLGGIEAVAPETALNWWFGTGAAPARPRRLAVGEPADFIVLPGRLDDAYGGDGRVTVQATVIAGEVVFVAKE